jgi:uncharacterized membrane protein AbrB (regulator of aidB expression)
MRKFLTFTATSAVIFFALSAIVLITDPLAWLLGPMLLGAIPVGLFWVLHTIAKRV